MNASPPPARGRGEAFQDPKNLKSFSPQSAQRTQRKTKRFLESNPYKKGLDFSLSL
jgi:hypothetical protein